MKSGRGTQVSGQVKDQARRAPFLAHGSVPARRSSAMRDNQGIKGDAVDNLWNCPAYSTAGAAAYEKSDDPVYVFDPIPGEKAALHFSILDK